jgi:hypothetical protein
MKPEAVNKLQGKTTEAFRTRNEPRKEIRHHKTTIEMKLDVEEERVNGRKK